MRISRWGWRIFSFFFFKPFHPLMTHPLRNLISVVANSLTAGLGRFWGSIFVTFHTRSIKSAFLHYKFQITRLKIDSNPFAKGFRDSIRILPMQRYVDISYIVGWTIPLLKGTMVFNTTKYPIPRNSDVLS